MIAHITDTKCLNGIWKDFGLNNTIKSKVNNNNNE